MVDITEYPPPPGESSHCLSSMAREENVFMIPFGLQSDSRVGSKRPWILKVGGVHPSRDRSRDTRREKEPTRHKDAKKYMRALSTFFRSRLPINRFLYSLNDTSFVKVDRVVYTARVLCFVI